MAQVGSKGSHNSPRAKRVSPMKPGLRDARNWATAQVRAASYSRKGFWRLVISVFVLAFSTVFFALWLGGFLPDARQVGQNLSRSSLVSLGFVVERVDVVGEGRMREEDVRAALGVKAGDFLFDMDVKAAQARIESLSWVERAIVRRLWPDRIVVQIIERRPFALWQNDGVVQLVDKDGAVISEADPLQFASLPLVIGENAADRMSELRAELNQFPAIAARVDAMSLLPSGRWDIRLGQSNMWVKLPEKESLKALKVVADLQASSQVLDRDIAVIDVRLPGRVSLMPRTAQPA